MYIESLLFTYQSLQLPPNQSVSVSFSYIYWSHFYICFALLSISTGIQEWLKIYNSYKYYKKALSWVF